jgi:hypothetical protein
MNIVTTDMRWYGEPAEIAVVQHILKDPFNSNKRWSIWVYDGYGVQALDDANVLYSRWYASARAAISQARVLQEEDTWKHLQIGLYYGGKGFNEKPEERHERFAIENDIDAIQQILLINEK